MLLLALIMFVMVVNSEVSSPPFDDEFYLDF